MDIEIIEFNKKYESINLPIDIINIIFSFLKKCYFCKLKNIILCEKHNNKYICSDCICKNLIKNLKRSGFLY